MAGVGLACVSCGAALPEGVAACPVCGALAPGARNLLAALPAGFLLRSPSEGYVVTRVLGQGGFAITYEARAGSGERVALKEFFPTGVTRGPAGLLASRDLSEERREFLREGQVLAALRHPGIVAVREWFETPASGGAFIVQELLVGESAQERLERKLFTLDEALRLTLALGEALMVVHERNLLHQDIKPENVMLTESRAVLIDFGSARAFSLDKTGTYDRILTPGFAPLEMYGTRVRRGPPTDVYALAATLFAFVSGAAPPPAPERANGAALPAVRGLPERARRAIDRALSVRMVERPATVSAFLDALGLAHRPPPRPVTPRLPRALALLERVARAEATANAPLSCPNGHGPLSEALESLACPVCRQGPLSLPPELGGAAPCPDCGRALRDVRVPPSLATAAARPTGGSASFPTGALRLTCPCCAGRLTRPRGERFTCPACRAARLVNRAPNLSACPVCREGELRRSPSPAFPCPDCRHGAVTPTTGLLGVFAPRRQCDACAARWRPVGGEYQLEAASGFMAARLGERHPQDEWVRLSERVGLEARCTHCASLFTRRAGNWRLTWTPRVTPLAGQVKTRLEWAKIAARRPVTLGNFECPACHSSFDVEGGRMRAALVNAAGAKLGGAWRSQAWPLDSWARLAAGKASPFDGLVCADCGAQFDFLNARGEGLLNADAPDPSGARLDLRSPTPLPGGPAPDTRRPAPLPEAPAARALHLSIPGRAAGSAGFPVSLLALAFRAAGSPRGQPGWVCDHCHAEWNDEPGGARQVHGRAAGRLQPRAAWISQALGRVLPEPGPTCRHCHAEWTLEAGGAWRLARVGALASPHYGATLSPQAWRRVAGGKVTPGPGLVCRACGLELTRAPGGGLTLSRAPGGPRVLAGVTLPERDWKLAGALQSTAAQGAPPLPADALRALRLEAAGEYRAALVNGELQAGDPAAVGETAHVNIAAQRAAYRNGAPRPNTPGLLSVTAYRVLFTPHGGGRGQDIPLTALNHVSAQNDLLTLQRADRARPVGFYTQDQAVTLEHAGQSIAIVPSAQDLRDLIFTLQARAP